MTRRVLTLSKYAADAASTRQRLLQYAPALEKAGFRLDLRPFLEDGHMRRLSRGASTSPTQSVGAYLRRFRGLGDARSADLLWIYAELFPYLPAWFESFAAKSGKPYIYDLDDAFFHAHDRHALLRDKLRPLIAGAAAVTAGNDYLAGYARQWNDHVHIIPTVVDTDAYVRATRSHDGPPVIGWIGSPSTWNYVRPLLPTLQDICSSTGARFLAVGAGKAAERDKFDAMELRDWSEATEIGDVQSMDVGIMPLPDEPWARGKCGYKLIQYMACGVPTLASPVGVNVALSDGGKTGLLANGAEAWEAALKQLLADVPLRQTLGQRGRQFVVEGYSLQSQAPRLVALMQSTVRS